MLGRGERVIDHDRVVHVPPKRRDHVETERSSRRRLAAGRRQDDEATWPEHGLPCRGPEVARKNPHDPCEEQVEENQEPEPDGPQDHREAVHQVGSDPSIWMTVPPTSRRSPTPNTTSLTGSPLTREPLVLPRSR